jgi:hypothetical protein
MMFAIQKSNPYPALQKFADIWSKERIWNLLHERDKDICKARE